MLYKILIIDDNHSFVDSLKVMLKDFPFHYDSAFRFIEADRKISNNQSLVRKDIVQQLLSFDERVRQWESMSDPEKKGEEEPPTSVLPPVYPEITESHVNEDGYFLVIVEHDTETSMKGLSFIQNIVRTNPHWDESDFLLLTSRYDEVEPTAKESGIAIIEKPLKSGPLTQFVRQHMKQTEELIERANMSLASVENQATIAAKLQSSRRGRKKDAATSEDEELITETPAPRAKAKSASKKKASTKKKATKKKSTKKKASAKKKATKKKAAAKKKAAKKATKKTVAKKKTKKKATKKKSPAKKKTARKRR